MDAKEIAAMKDELRKDMEALERVERMMATKNSKLGGGSPAPDDRQMALGVPEDDEYDTEAPADSLRGTIERIVNADPAARWTTSKVLTKLQEMQYDLRAKKPIYSVGQSLNVLAKKGRIRLARKGSGSAPNIYKAKPQEPVRNHDGGHDLGLTQ